MWISNLHIPHNAKNDPKTRIPSSDAVTTENGIHIRDPYILLYNGRYYLYHSLGKNGIGCRVSEDLEHWSESVTVYTPPADFHGIKNFFWAPECHYYKGKFYIFTSVFSKQHNENVVSVYRADNPLGPFEDIAGGCITPEGWATIDGTLYLDEAGDPWMVFVYEWKCKADGNGSMAAARLSEDFTHFITEPVELFHAKEPAWAVHGVTDGCYLLRTDDGELRMIWSNFSKNNYVVAVAKSSSGNVLGPWEHCDKLLFEKGLQPEFVTDGGHAMIFLDKQDQLTLALHGPNNPKEGEFEYLQLYRLSVQDNELRIDGAY